MGTRREYFFKNLIISDEDKKLADRYLASKGIEKHIILKKMLFSFVEGKELEYSMIASVYRYDKRLRNILFKYISYLEEFYRAVILDTYRFSAKNVKWIDDIKEKLDEQNWDLDATLERIEFSTLLKQADLLPPRIRKRFLFPQNKHHNENSKAVRGLRNAVMHNKFLLLYRGFETCYVNGVDEGKSTNLKANILNLLSFLPEEVAENCREEINAAKNEKADHCGTKWNLPPFVVIQI